MPSRHRRPSASKTILRVAVMLAIAVSVPAVVVDGDLLVLPALALVVLAWLAVGLLALGAWVLSKGAPALVATGRTAAQAGWAAIAEDPLGHRLHQVAGRLRRGAAPLLPVWGWLRRRLVLAPAGLPLTLAVLATATAARGLVWLGGGVDQPRSALSRFDLRVADAASRLEVSGERRVMAGLTHIGATRSVLLLAAVLVAGAVAARAWRSGLLLVATLATSSALVTLLKVTHARPRPALGQLVETSTSFPSGHAAAALSLAFGLLLWWWAAGLRRPAAVAALVVPLALLVGYSRAYLSIHWMSDVVAGWLVAVAAAAAVLATERLLAALGWRSAGEPRLRPLALASAVAGVVTLAVAVGGGHRFPTELPPTQPTRLASADPAAVLAPLPRFTETLLGRRMEPIGLVIVAAEAELRAAVRDAGWMVAARPTPGRVLRTYWAGLSNRADPTAPVTPTFLDARLQDLAIQRQSLGRGVKARHHARLWQLPLVTPEGCPVWAVTASLDDRAEWTLRTLLPNHHIAPAIDVERDYLADSLTRAGRLVDEGRFPLVGPTLGTNAAGDPFFTDGAVALVKGTLPC